MQAKWSNQELSIAINACVWIRQPNTCTIGYILRFILTKVLAQDQTGLPTALDKLPQRHWRVGQMQRTHFPYRDNNVYLNLDKANGGKMNLKNGCRHHKSSLSVSL